MAEALGQRAMFRCFIIYKKIKKRNEKELRENYKQQNNKEENIISQMTFGYTCLNGIPVLSLIQIDETGKYEHFGFKETYPWTYFSIINTEIHTARNISEK